jgi:hypothetical protein
MFKLWGSDRIYVISCCGITHISAYEGWVRQQIVPDWTEELVLIDAPVPQDVREWLESL